MSAKKHSNNKVSLYVLSLIQIFLWKLEEITKKSLYFLVNSYLVIFAVLLIFKAEYYLMAFIFLFSFLTSLLRLELKDFRPTINYNEDPGGLSVFVFFFLFGLFSFVFLGFFDGFIMASYSFAMLAFSCKSSIVKS